MSFSSYEQVFILNNQLVSGVSSVDAGYNTQTEPLYIAGMGYVDNFISGPTEGQLEVSRYMLGSDFIKNIGDEDHVSGGIVFDNGQSVGFTRGRMLNYTVSCNVGQVPEIRNTFKVYGNLGGGISPIKRWEPGEAYAVGDLVSVSKTDTQGFAEDQVYKCLEANSDSTMGTCVDGLPTKESCSSDHGDTHWTANGKWESKDSLGWLEELKQKYKLEDRDYTIPTPGSITVSFQGSGENAVQGFNYSRGLDLESLYALREEQFKGKSLTDYEAIDVQIMYPVKTTFDFSVSFDDYKLSDMRAFLDYANWTNGRIEQDISVKIKDPQDDSKVLMEYKVSKAKLLSEATSSQPGNETSLKIAFEGYETDPGTADPRSATKWNGTQAVDYSASGTCSIDGYDNQADCKAATSGGVNGVWTPKYQAIDQGREYRQNQVKTESK
jgi:hypothetical protein